MTPEYLLVDGYNVINAWPKLRELGNLEHAHTRLVELLTSHRAFRGIEVIVVFDSPATVSQPPQDFDGVMVIYSTASHQADHVIEALAHKLSKVEGLTVTVASSDSLERRLVFGLGCQRLSAAELMREIQGTLDTMSREYGPEQPPAHTTSVADRLTEPVREALCQISLGQEI
jgi:predicted RNA-binding protein with PIN domain